MEALPHKYILFLSITETCVDNRLNALSTSTTVDNMLRVYPYFFSCDTNVTTVTFWTSGPGKFYLGSWEYNVKKTRFTLLEWTSITSIASRLQTVYLDQPLFFQSGSAIGIHFDSGADGILHYAYNEAHLEYTYNKNAYETDMYDGVTIASLYSFGKKMPAIQFKPISGGFMSTLYFMYLVFFLIRLTQYGFITIYKSFQ